MVSPFADLKFDLRRRRFERGDDVDSLLERDFVIGAMEVFQKSVQRESTGEGANGGGEGKGDGRGERKNARAVDDERRRSSKLSRSEARCNAERFGVDSGAVKKEGGEDAPAKVLDVQQQGECEGVTPSCTCGGLG